MASLGFVGYGRFGRSLAEIFAQSGHMVRAFDPFTEVRGDVSEPRLEGLVERSEAIFVATPVTAMPTVIDLLSEQPVRDKLVIDVGSVKVEPQEWMRKSLGASGGWVATHPLFGPVSLARAEGLRAVICPRPERPDAAKAAADLYASIGCAVTFMEAEEHDRIMAQTHALAFFVAKGMLNAGVPANSPVAPPSFQAMARTIESVRADAGHLLSTLHRENPYAGKYRAQFLRALQELDRNLASENRLHPGAVELTIEASDEAQPLEDTRDRIDEIDRDLFELLRRRAELSRRARAAKVATGRQIVDEEREQSMMAARSAWARDGGLDETAITRVFQAIVEMSREIQAGGG